MEKDILEHGLNHNRRRFLSKLSLGLGSAALGSLLMPDLFRNNGAAGDQLTAGLPHFCTEGEKDHLSFSKWRTLTT